MLILLSSVGVHCTKHTAHELKDLDLINSRELDAVSPRPYILMEDFVFLMGASMIFHLDMCQHMNFYIKIE
jgi:hypothetical protein